MFTFKVANANGTTTVMASLTASQVPVAQLSVPSLVFSALQGIQGRISNKELQQLIAKAAGWDLNESKRSPKAAALIEKICPGYLAHKTLKSNSYLGQPVISLLEAYEINGARFYELAQAYQAREAQMLTRHGKL